MGNEKLIRRRNETETNNEDENKELYKKKDKNEISRFE